MCRNGHHNNLITNHSHNCLLDVFNINFEVRVTAAANQVTSRVKCPNQIQAPPNLSRSLGPYICRIYKCAPGLVRTVQFSFITVWILKLWSLRFLTERNIYYVRKLELQAIAQYGLSRPGVTGNLAVSPIFNAPSPPQAKFPRNFLFLFCVTQTNLFVPPHTTRKYSIVCARSLYCLYI